MELSPAEINLCEAWAKSEAERILKEILKEKTEGGEENDKGAA